MAEEHDLGREQRFVVVHAGIVDAGDIRRGEDPDHARYGFRCPGADREHLRVRLGYLYGVCVQDVFRAGDEVVGVQRGAPDVRGRGFVGAGDPDGRAFRAFRKCAHARAPSRESA